MIWKIIMKSWKLNVNIRGKEKLFIKCDSRCRLYMYVIDTNMYVIFQYAASTAFYSFTVVGSCMAVSDSG